MAYWWETEPRERFWVEIRKRPGHGVDLWSPVRDEDGGTDPWYELVSSVRAGEVIYHWSAREHRFVGRSLAASDAFVADGLYRVELAGFVPIEADISLAQVRAQAPALYGIRDRLLAVHGAPLYLPFQFKKDASRLSFMSNYFAKLPEAMVDLLFGVDGLGESGVYRLPAQDGDTRITPAEAIGHWRVGFLQPFRPKADTDYNVTIRGGTPTRGRSHETLVNRCAEWLRTQDLEPGRNAAVDLGLEAPPVVIEAKVVKGSWPDAIRAAVGQLYEYRYFRVADRRSRLILLTDAAPSDEWIEYLERDREIGAMWPDGDGFALSRLARRALGL